MSRKDLIPQSKRTPEEREKVARMGGIASGEAKRRKKAFRELLLSLLQEKVSMGNKKITKLEAILLRTIQEVGSAPSVSDVEKLMKMAGLYSERIEVEELQEKEIIINFTTLEKR